MGTGPLLYCRRVGVKLRLPTPLISLKGGSQAPRAQFVSLKEEGRAPSHAPKVGARLRVNRVYYAPRSALRQCQLMATEFRLPSRHLLHQYSVMIWATE